MLSTILHVGKHSWLKNFKTLLPYSYNPLGVAQLIRPWISMHEKENIYIFMYKTCSQVLNFYLLLCLCWDKDPRHVQEAIVHHPLSNPCFGFFLQLPYYGVASMATIVHIYNRWISNNAYPRLLNTGIMLFGTSWWKNKKVYELWKFNIKKGLTCPGSQVR